MATRKSRRPVNSKGSKQAGKKSTALFLKTVRLRSDPLGEFTWVTGGRAYFQGSEGNNQPQFGLWYSPVRYRSDRLRKTQRTGTTNED